MIQGILFCVALFIAYIVGWIHAHATVATECERLGSFYVGAKTYQCSQVEARK